MMKRLRRPALGGLSLLSALLGACGSSPVRDCEKLAGPSWTPLTTPPVNAQLLLSLEDLPNEAELVWLSSAKGKVMACFYSTTNLTHPGCGNSSAYVFEQKNGRWVSSGTVLDVCGRFDAIPEP